MQTLTQKPEKKTVKGMYITVLVDTRSQLTDLEADMDSRSLPCRLWSKEPKDIRTKNALELEKKVEDKGILLKLCNDYWIADRMPFSAFKNKYRAPRNSV